MGAVAVIAHTRGRDATGDVTTMLAAAPHRGVETAVRAYGEIVMGICRPGDARGQGDATDAGLAQVDGHLVAYTGAIDNLAALSTQAADPHDATDVAAALARLFVRHGEQILARLRGIYAMCVSDGRRLWIFRDHLGFKPLFYRVHDRQVVAATEAKQVAAGVGLRPEADLAVVEEVFYDTHDDDTPAAIRGVRRLPKATVLQSVDGRVSTRRYWAPDHLLETGGRLTADELQDRFDALMTQAVSRCLTGADAVSLSGGIDSSVIAGYAAPVHAGRYGRPLGALSVVYPDQPAVDERRYIELLAKELDLDLHLRPNETRRMDALDELSRLVDGPVPTVALEEMERYYRHARRLGYRSVLAGEVAEFVIDAREGIMPHLLATGRLGEAARRLRHLRAGGVRPLALLRSVGAVAVPRTVASARAKWIKRRTVPDFLDARRITANYVRQKPPPRHRWRERQLAAFRGPGVSIEADEIIHTTCGVQVRRPWIDVDLWEFFLALPADHKYPAGGLRKSLVRELSRGRVPDEVLDRTDKTVFDDAVMAGIDYSALRGWVRRGDFRMPGVNYERLEQRLTAEDLTLHDYIWAQDLAVAHAFIAAMRGDVPQRVRQTRGTSP